MSRLIPLLFLLADACIIYVPPGWHRDRDDDGDDLVEDTDVATGDSATPEQPEATAADVRLHPSGAALGQTIIASLVDHSDPPVDLSQVTDVDLL
ncbi:MAG TPA: hypothetical protein PKA64_24435, partial [Myxococcota bacterium]|nr:hypothetical protein [Myxococcota bacterium]